MTRPLRLASALLAAFGLAACAETQRRMPSAQELDQHAHEVTQEYFIGPHDQLAISVWQQPNLSLESVVVRLDGKISVPLLDDVVAAGLTATELKQVLTEGLSEYIRDPQVTVVVRQINSKLIYTMGEVAKVGPMQLRGGMRVVDALSTAGGFKAFADKRKVKVIRHINGSDPIEFLFDYKSFASGENLEQNILLLPGDRIVVPEQAPFWR